MVAQAGVCLLDVKDATVDQAVEQARRGALSAYKHAYFHPERMRELVARVSAERGADVTVGCFFNDLSARLSSPDSLVPTAEEWAAALRTAGSDAAFRWTGRKDIPVERLFVTVDDVPEGSRFEFRVDTHFISPAATEALARAMETAAIEAALAAPGLRPVVG
jgi:hypothetical protein